MSDEFEARLSAWYSRLEPRCRQAKLLGPWLAGELPPEEAYAFETHLRGCPECAADRTAFEAVAELWSMPTSPARPSFLRWLARPFATHPMALAGALAAVALAIGVVANLPLRPSADHRLASKGGWRLHLAVEREGRVFRAQDGALLRTGDRLGLFYSSGQDGYVSVFYVEQAGRVTRLSPAAGEAERPRAAATEARLPDGAVLTDGTGCEWVVGFLSAAPLPEAEVLSRLEHAVAARNGCTLRLEDLEGAQVQVLGVRR